LGGVVALESYTMLGGAIRGLVLVSTLHVLPPKMMEIAGLLRSRGNSAWTNIASILVYRMRGPRILEEISKVMARNDPAYIANIIELLRGADYSEIASKVDSPTLVIVGGKDQITPPGEVARFASMFRRSRLVVVENAGHLLLLEAPGELARAIESFLGG
ncbi:MAG: alpha/beta hydrolase, partial [Desulfurococcales archaeon]|nr:alpha/beta hydrolase [Desulfurococcales archaeon]